jgi:hypothetical protein
MVPLEPVLASAPRSFSSGSIIAFALLLFLGYVMITWRRNREQQRKAQRREDERRTDHNERELNQGRLRPPRDQGLRSNEGADPGETRAGEDQPE